MDGTSAPGAQMTLQRITDFLSENPDRNVLIEGHTDATGPASYNQQLSMQRAAAVRDELVSSGVDASRVRASGLGETFPVATNSTEAGRQLNRRVEVVLSDGDGEFAAGAIRTASLDEVESGSTATR